VGTSHKDMRELVRKVEAQGWKVTMSGRTQTTYRMMSPDGSVIIFAAVSSGDRRAYANTVARLRQAGVKGI
jgi:hypothetical protein